MKFTGERLTTDVRDGNAVRHLHRYAITFGSIREKRVVDIACGEGYGANLMADIAGSVHGIDISEEAILHARSKYVRPNLVFSVGSVDSMPVATGSTDVVVSFETIEHHDRHEAMMTEIKRILIPKGLAIISSPDKYVNTVKTGVVNPYHVKELHLEEFRDLAKKYFKNVRMMHQKEVFGSLIVPEDKANNYEEYCGGYLEIQTRGRASDFTFNICFASDGEFTPAAISYYDAHHLIDRLRMDYASLLNSRAFRLRRLVTEPLKTLLKRLA